MVGTQDEERPFKEAEGGHAGSWTQWAAPDGVPQPPFLHLHSLEVQGPGLEGWTQAGVPHPPGLGQEEPGSASASLGLDWAVRGPDG